MTNRETTSSLRLPWQLSPASPPEVVGVDKSSDILRTTSQGLLGTRWRHRNQGAGSLQCSPKRLQPPSSVYAKCTGKSPSLAPREHKGSRHSCFHCPSIMGPHTCLHKCRRSQGASSAHM